MSEKFKGVWILSVPTVYIYISAGNYFYSYIIIPATINHNNVYTITND